MKSKKGLTEQTLDAIAAICIVVFFSALILKIWLIDEIQYLLNRCWATSLLIFIFLIVLHTFLFYEPKKKKK